MAKDCIHKWQVDSQNVGTCSLCGEVRQFPLEGGEEMVVLKESNLANKPSKKRVNYRTKSIKNRRRYYTKNKKAIVADLLAMGRVGARQKWGIPKGTIGNLIHRWLTPEQIAAIPTGLDSTPLKVSANIGKGNGWLPPLPFFENTWDAPVQVKWLEVYEKLAIEVKSKP